MDKKLRIAFVGCGHIANGKHLPALSKIKEAEIKKRFVNRELMETAHSIGSYILEMKGRK